MRYIAIDLGEKRTGVAVGESISGLVTPAGVLEVPSAAAGDGLLSAVLAAIDEHFGTSAGEVVVGLPLNMDDSEGPASKRARAFAAQIAARTGRAVHVQDERLTSADADWAMARSGLTHKQKKQRRDALAAAAILRDFLAAQARAAGEQDPASDLGV